MVAVRVTAQRRWPTRLALCAGVGMLLAGCGQRGALYIPDRNARVVTRDAGTSAPASAPASTPSAAAPSAPAAAPTAAPR